MKPVKLDQGARKLLSVRARLIAFALLCAVPVLVLTGLQMRRDDVQVQTQAEERARILAERLDTRMRLVLGASESVAHSIGALELARSAPGPACSLALQRALAAAGPLALDFTLSSPTGEVWCSALPHAGTQVADLLHFREAVASLRPVLSGITSGGSAPRTMLQLAVPIIGLDGRVTAVASAALDGPAMTRGLLSATDEANTAAVLLDRSGALVSRWPQRVDLRPGTHYEDSPLFRLVQQRQEGAVAVRGLDGTQRMFITRPVNHGGETVLWAAVGVDVESLEALAQAGNLRDLAIVLLVACAVVLVAVAATRPLVLGRARALQDVARQVARGDYGRRVPLRVRDELTSVEQALNLMLDAVEADRASLVDSENRYRLLFEYSMDGVLETTPEGAILAANAAACQMLGRSEAELATLGRKDLVDANDARLAAMLRERSETGRARAELTFVRGDGSPMEVALSSTVFCDRHGRERACIVFHDVTERNAAREQVLRLNRELEARVARRTQELEAANRELEAFSYTVSHDLRAPVAVIRSFAEILEERGALKDEKHLHYLRRIRASGQTMSELIDGLLALAQISRAQLDWSVVDVSELAREAVQQLVEGEPGRSVEIDIAPGMHAVADARLLRVVLSNLIGNAWKFTRDQPNPRISVAMTVSAAGGSVFGVRDNGDGFDPAYAHRLFVAFHRLHGSAEFPGLGIGLATVHRIVQRHGGRIWAEGRPGQGAAFYFELGSRDESLARPMSAAEDGRVAPA